MGETDYNSLPIILVSAKDNAAASYMISEIIDNDVTDIYKAKEADAVQDHVWRIVNKYYTADVRLQECVDQQLPIGDEPVDAHIIYLKEDECAAATCSRRALAGADVRLAVCARADAPLRAWCAEQRYELVALAPADEDGGVPRVRAALAPADEDGGVPRVRAALSPADEDGGVPRVRAALSPADEDGGVPRVRAALAPADEDGGVPRVRAALSPADEDGGVPRVRAALSPADEDGGVPRVRAALSPADEDGGVPRVRAALSPADEDGGVPRVRAALSPADEDGGVPRVRAALHAHVWRGHARTDRPPRDRDADSDGESSVERAELFAAALSALPAAASARGGGRAARLARAELLLAEFCRALGLDPDRC